MRITLILPIPPSVNKLTSARINWKVGKVYKPYQYLKEAYALRVISEANRVYGGSVKLTGRLVLTVESNNNLDWDNQQKVVCDGLAKAFHFNDKTIREAHIYADSLDVDKDKIRVTLEERERES